MYSVLNQQFHSESAQTHLERIDMTDLPPWYHEGLRFECSQCGNCCTGNPGVVWVTDEEIREIAKVKGLTLGEMRIHHTRVIGSDVSLREFPNGDCTFFDGATRKCTVYAARPAQCRTWPFWNSNLESPETWQRAKAICPGMDHGKLVQLESIRQQADFVDI